MLIIEIKKEKNERSKETRSSALALEEIKYQVGTLLEAEVKGRV